MLRLLIPILAVFLAMAVPVRAATVDLALVLAVDMSGSINADEARLQREGYVRALTDPAVINAIRGGPLGRIAVTYIEWSDVADQRIIVDWTMVNGAGAASAVASAIESADFRPGRRTALGEAILFAMSRFKENPFKATRRVIDVSGDGHSNVGTPAYLARNKAIAAGITINGLPILDANPRLRARVRLAEYYLDRVIGGPDAFLIAARDFRDFGRAIRQKMLKEIAMAPGLKLAFAAGPDDKAGAPSLPALSRRPVRTGKDPSRR